MKKTALFSRSNRPNTSKKQSPQQNSFVNSIKKLSIETKDFNPNHDQI